ncbi:MAG: tetratricopeptide repeat protein [Deltaproteobacteria bacterium]|nr:tetratricopeptide repeat protein [Deltaproteobacteria bacterium]MBI3076300.1 tetratricopeptide repeat protein [Deltaproteobacteria bacterium]
MARVRSVAAVLGLVLATVVGLAAGLVPGRAAAAGHGPRRDDRGYVIRAAAFVDRAPAQRLAERLSRKRYRASVLAVSLADSSIWYLVLVGPYRSAEEARRAAGRLERAESLSTSIARRDILGPPADAGAFAVQRTRAESGGIPELAAGWYRKGYEAQFGVEQPVDLDAAVTAYLKAVELHPRFAEAYNNLGIAYLARGDTAKAIEAFEQAARVRPGYADAHFNLGVALATSGAVAKAVDAYQDALRMRPDFFEAHHNLARTYEDLGDLAHAVEAYEAASRLRADHAEVRYALAVVHLRRGALQQALGEWHRASDLDPEPPRRPETLIAPGQGIGLFRLGTPVVAVRQLLGPPHLVTPATGSRTSTLIYVYRDPDETTYSLALTVDDSSGRVVGIETDLPFYALAQGIGVGAEVGDMEATLGQWDRREVSPHGFVEYGYERLGLRFRVSADGQVEGAAVIIPNPPPRAH